MGSFAVLQSTLSYRSPARRAGGPIYFEDMQAIFQGLAGRIKPDSVVVVEVSNIRTTHGFRPLVAQFTQLLGEVFCQTGQIVRVNTSDWPAGPGVSWSAMLVFKPEGN